MLSTVAQTVPVMDSSGMCNAVGKFTEKCKDNNMHFVIVTSGDGEKGAAPLAWIETNCDLR